MPAIIEPVERWILFFTGFLQTEGSRPGLEQLHRLVHQRCSGPNTLVELKSWRDSAKDVAQRIKNWEDPDAPPKVVVCGFSYGGYTAVLTCRELQKYGIKVESLLLCDPVARLFARLPSVFSMLDVLPMKIPANVENLYTWRQTFNRPQGAKITLADKDATRWLPEHDYHSDIVPHTCMDDLTEFHQIVRRVACPRGAQPV